MNFSTPVTFGYKDLLSLKNFVVNSGFSVLTAPNKYEHSFIFLPTNFSSSTLAGVNSLILINVDLVFQSPITLLALVRHVVLIPSSSILS